MKKYFIADVLTAAKIIPAVGLIIATICGWSPLVALAMFAAGELLDALDGMAAVRWPHPRWTRKLWFRKKIKLIESGTDALLGLAALLFVMFRVDRQFGATALYLALIVGGTTEIIVYGKLFGTAKNCNRYSLANENPELAKTIVNIRLVVYLFGIAAVMLRLFLAIGGTLTRIVLMIVAILVAIIVLVKKYEDGRLDGVVAVIKKIRKGR